MNKVIALDLGNVCIQLHHDRYFKELGTTPENLPQAFLQSCKELERGRISESEWLKHCRHNLPQVGNLTDDEIWEKFNIPIGTDMPGMAELARELVNNGFRLVLFSNTSQVHALEATRNMSFSPLISGAVYSFECGHMKPSAMIYEVFEEKYGIPAAYLDDRGENIDAAEKRGWNSHLFTDTPSARVFFQDTVSGSL